MIAKEFRLVGSGPRKFLVTDHEVARRLRVSKRMVRLWIDTGAWPLPRSAEGISLLFDPADVECWLETGAWPAGMPFRVRARRIPVHRSSDLHPGPMGRTPPAARPRRVARLSLFDDPSLVSCCSGAVRRIDTKSTSSEPDIGPDRHQLGS
jgi:hypothetical protein